MEAEGERVLDLKAGDRTLASGVDVFAAVGADVGHSVSVAYLPTEPAATFTVTATVRSCCSRAIIERAARALRVCPALDDRALQSGTRGPRNEN